MAFNWVDLVIVLLLGVSGYFAAKIGFYRQAFIMGGFFGGLFLAGTIVPYLLPIKDPTLLLIVNCNLVLLIALYMGIRGYDIGHHIKRNIKHSKHHALEVSLGALAGSLAMLLIIWLLAVVVGRMPFAGLSNSANDSFTIQKLNTVLPPVPAIFARLDRLIDPNAQPRIFEGHQPRPKLVTGPLPKDLNQAVKDTSDSVVRMTGFGCGGIVAGSGFVVGPELVATNAHVIAGVERPIIKTPTGSYEGVPVLFNPSMDVAIMRVKGLAEKPIALAPGVIKNGTAIAAMGYPNGNFTVHSGKIISKEGIIGSNIYGVGRIGRDVYYVQSDLGTGISGGPIVLANGQSAGMIFAKSETTENSGYVLMSASIKPLVDKAQTSTSRVGTGACTVF